MSELLNARYSVIDVEATGLNPKKDEIVALAIIPMVGTRILIGNYFFTFVKPKKLKADSIKYHGIDFKAIEDAPPFCKIANEVEKILNGSVIVGYATDFDVQILKKHFSKSKLKPELKYVDVAQIEKWIARRNGVSVTHVDLDDLIEKYSLGSMYRHSALADAYYTARIFQHQLKRLVEHGVHKLEELLSMGKREKLLFW
jgi:DNA polymerase-3 subunit epsilon